MCPLHTGYSNTINKYLINLGILQTILRLLQNMSTYTSISIALLQEVPIIVSSILSVSTTFKMRIIHSAQLF